MRQGSWIALAVLGLLAVAVPLRALADAYQDWSCPKGSFLVGFSGYRGAWIDELAPRCASWENWATKLSGSSQPAPADWFGKPAEARARFQRDELCAGNEAVTAVRWGLATPDDEVHLQNLQIQCTNVISRIVNQQWHTELRRRCNLRLRDEDRPRRHKPDATWPGLRGVLASLRRCGGRQRRDHRPGELAADGGHRTGSSG